MAPKIFLLDTATAMKIAAGEVIERPASAVRELLDNALDADATRISIAVEKGGKDYLSIQDNGLGMSEEDIPKSYLNHATSKITSFDDLFQLKTFGFRGEALASLAEIAELTIASCERGKDYGAELAIRFGKKGDLLPKGMNQGTAVTITQFFQNVPARLKFLSTDTSEYRAIVQEIIKKALAKPQVAFELSHNGEQKYKLNSCRELFDRIVDLFPELRSVLRAFFYEEQGVKVYGFLSHPSWYKPTRSYQYFFVNGRAIEWQAFRQQISVAYNNLLPPSKFPAVFCYLEVDARQVDYNVHPQKKEIRFDQEKIIADIVRRGLKKGLEQSHYTLSDDTEKIYISEKKDDPKPYVSKIASPYSSYRSQGLPKTNPSSAQLNSLFQQQTQETETLLVTAIYKGTIFQTYLLFEEGNVLFLVDFHAMHERIRYEEILSRHQQGLPSQGVFPFVFETAEADIFEQIREGLATLGFSLTPIGKTSFSVEAVPAILEIGQAETVLRDLFTEDLSSIQDSYYWDALCKMIACKGSSRSGDSLNEIEIQTLLKKWRQCTHPQSCPHGRPIVVPMKKSFFDKAFKRTGF